MKKEGRGEKRSTAAAENSPGRLHGSAHGLFILRISAGDLRAGLWAEAGWQTANCESV